MRAREPRRTITELVLLACYLVNSYQLLLGAYRGERLTLMAFLHLMALALCVVGIYRLEQERTAEILDGMPAW